MKIAVAGGTGTVGRYVVDALRGAGHDAVVLTRSSGVDLMKGTGLADALRGVDTVVDVSARNTTSARESVVFFETVTRNLLEAEHAAGVTHHVALSVIGAVQADTAYYAGKAAQEKILTARPSGWSLLRTTQFFEFTQLVASQGRVGPLNLVPQMHAQPIAAREVAAEVAAIAQGTPQGLVPDLAGPQPARLSDLVRRYLRATGHSRPVLQVVWPGAWGRAMRDGTFMPAPRTRRGSQTFDSWLAEVAK